MRFAAILLAGILLGRSGPAHAVPLDLHADPHRSEDPGGRSVARLESGHQRVIVRRAAGSSGSCDDRRAELLRIAHSRRTSRSGAPVAMDHPLHIR